MARLSINTRIWETLRFGSPIRVLLPDSEHPHSRTGLRPVNFGIQLAGDGGNPVVRVDTSDERDVLASAGRVGDRTARQLREHPGRFPENLPVRRVEGVHVA